MPEDFKECKHENRHTKILLDINKIVGQKYQEVIVSLCADCGQKLREVEVKD